MTSHNLENIHGLRDATRAGAGVYWDFASGRAKVGRVWQQECPAKLRAELMRDCTEEELQACREATGIDRVQAASSGDTPICLVIIGPSGAGKSMALKKAAELFQIDLSKFAHVDGDDMRSCHKAWKECIVDDQSTGYLDAYDIYISNKTNKDLKKRYSKECLKARQNVIFPWTNIEEAALELMKEQGYRIYVLGLLISCAESDCRQKNRAETNGRWADTPAKKWLVTVEHLAKMCEPSSSEKALVYDSTDVLNMRLVYSRGISGVDDPADLSATIEKLKTDMSYEQKTTKDAEGHAWCEGLSLMGYYKRPGTIASSGSSLLGACCIREGNSRLAGEVKAVLADSAAEVSELRLELTMVSGFSFKCLFAVKGCALHLPGEKPGKEGEQIGKFNPVSCSIVWDKGSPFGPETWEQVRKLNGKSIERSVKDDLPLMQALAVDGNSTLDFSAQPFRTMTDKEWAGALEACCVTGEKAAPSREKPKALIVMAPSAGGKTTVVTRLAGSFGIEIEKSVRADGAIFRDFHQQYALLCENGVTNGGIWFNAWPAAKSIVQKAKKLVLKDALEKKQDLVISDTGAEVESIEKLTSMLKKGGYLICLVGIYADPQAILQRGIAREIGEGKRYNRSIPKLRQTFEHFGAAISMIDGPFKIVQNAHGQEPAVKLEGTGYNGAAVPQDVQKVLDDLVGNL